MDAMYLVMDMINDLVHEDGPSAKSYGPELKRRSVLENTAAALQKARDAGLHIGYVRVGFSPDYREVPPTSRIFTGARKAGLFKLGTWGTEVHPSIAPQPGDFDIVKHRVSPFYCTDLEILTGAHGIKRLFMSGVSTSGVVLSGAKEGHDRDYEITLLEDCCCHSEPALHDAVIETMRRIATITTSTDVSFA